MFLKKRVKVTVSLWFSVSFRLFQADDSVKVWIQGSAGCDKDAVRML